MRDKWMNTGYEEDELRPYVEPQQDFKDHKRIGENYNLITLKYSRYCYELIRNGVQGFCYCNSGWVNETHPYAFDIESILP